MNNVKVINHNISSKKRLKQNRSLLLLLLIVYAQIINAQAINSGEIYVSPNDIFTAVGAFQNTNTAEFVNEGDVYFFGDIDNAGMFDFESSNATTYLAGNELQKISGSSPFYNYNLTVENTSGAMNAIAVSGQLEVANELTLTQGIVNTTESGGQLILSSNARVSGASHDSHVDGFVEKLGNTSFTFPVGDEGFYRNANLENQSGAYRIRYVYQDSLNPYPSKRRIGNAFFMSDEYWVVQNDNTEEVRVTLSWDETTTTLARVVSNPEAIRMVRWNFEQEAWMLQEATVDVLNRTVSSIQNINDSEMAVFNIAGADLDIILPDGVIVWNALSPNGDGKNDYLFIEQIDQLPNNTLKIYNRWGAEIFSTSNYDTVGNVFRGYAKGQDRFLPSGTYFYVLSYDSSQGRVDKGGCLYLTSD